MSGASAPSSTWSPTAARDRLSSTLFFAALLHGVVILGITFGAPRDHDQAPLALDVVLVRGDAQADPAPDARLLAEQNLAGADGGRSEPRWGLPALAGQVAPETPPANGQQYHEPPGEPAVADSPAVVATTDSSLKLAAAAENGTAPDQARGLVDESSLMTGDLDGSVRLRDAEMREIEISASTREARIAPWLAGWKNRVEQFGTLNYPNLAPVRHGYSNPVLEVAINASGELHEVRLRRSSGLPELDQAAIGILRAAAPFQPFPEELRREYDVLRFAYEWRFTGTSIRTAAGR